MAVATACSGLTEKAFFTLRYIYIYTFTNNYLLLNFWGGSTHASNKVIYDRVKKGTVKNNNFEIPDAFLFLLPLHEEFEEPEILK